MAFNKIVVVGAGVMGQGIAEAIATTGTDVILLDRTARLADIGIERIGENIDHEIEKWGLTLSEKKAILSRIVPSTDLQVAKMADLIIEAIPEKLRQKRELFQRLDDLETRRPLPRRYGFCNQYFHPLYYRTRLGD